MTRLGFHLDFHLGSPKAIKIKIQKATQKVISRHSDLETDSQTVTHSGFQKPTETGLATRWEKQTAMRWGIRMRLVISWQIQMPTG